MRRLCTTAIVLIVMLGQGMQAATEDPQKVLVIGNSLTYTYGIPKILEEMATASAKKLKITAHMAGGKDLTWHWSNPSGKPATTAPEAIAKGPWDIVILQDSSQTANKPEEVADFKKVTRDLFDLATKGTQTRVLFYMGFVRKADITEAGAKSVIDMYSQQADLLGINCAPVALAFVRCVEKSPKIALIDNQKGLKYALDKTGTHQSPFGSYLAACTIYAAIYDQTPVGNTYRKSNDGATVIADEDAALAQQVAWDTWTAYKAARKPAPPAKR